MKIATAAALIALTFTPATLPPLVSIAAADPVDLGLCGVRAPASSGWTCDERVTSVTHYSVGELTFDGLYCWDYERTNVAYVGVSPAGRDSKVFSSTGYSDVVVSGLYTNGFTSCNYPGL